MEIRPIRPDEYSDAENIRAQAFHYTKYEQPVNDTGNKHENIFAVFDDFGKMTSALNAYPYRVAYFGQPDVKMCGIGGVASLPETRREGHMRKLLEYALTASYERGDKLAALYPFSHEFYRKFGFEVTCRRTLCTFSMQCLKNFSYSGTMVQLFPSMDASPLKAVYSAWQKGVNLACDRKEEWKRYLEDDPYTTRRYVYLWHDSEGQPQGYLVLTPEKIKEDVGYRILECVYLTPEALQGMLGFLRLMSPQGHHVNWFLPAGLDSFLLFPEPYDQSIARMPGGMARIINAKWCLENRIYAEDSGTLTLELKDDVLTQNSGFYILLLEGGKAQVTKEEALPAADVTLSVQALTLLCLGANTVDELLLTRKDIRVFDHLELLQKMFQLHSNQLTEAF